MKKLLVVLMVVLAAPSFAVVTKFTFINHSNHTLQCAIAQIANANPSAPEVTVYHWFVIPNGQQSTFNGRTDGYFCEAQGAGFKYSSNNAFVCVSRSSYVNPIYKANLLNTCNSIGGEMVGFRNVSGFGASSITLNAPN